MALCFNHAPYVLECLQSIAAQTYGNSELIILDNHSDDGSQEIIQQWAATANIPVKLFLETQRRGICANINLMLAHATGEYVALIAADDYWLPEKTSRQVEVFEQLGTQFAVAYADALCIDAQGTVMEPASFIQTHRQFETLPTGDLLHELLRGPFIPTMSTMIRRSALLAMGPYDESLIYEDYDAWLRLAEHWHFHADPMPLCAYRILNSSMIRTIAAQDKPEKILSDARIMAKAATIPRLEEKSRTNTKRRIISLAIQLINLPGNWHDAPSDLQRRTNLSTLSLLAAAQKYRKLLSPDDSHRLLANAITHGFLPASEFAAQPKAVTNLLNERDPKRPAPRQLLSLPEGHDITAWEQLYIRLEREATAAAQSTMPVRKSWWKLGLG